jgi:hypothetical protein
MASFTIIESAVKTGLTTYKAIVEQLCQQNADLAATLLEQVSLKDDDPKILRKKHRAEQVEKFGKDDKDSINAAMKAYDVSFKKANPDAKPKRAPPVRKWTEEDKAFTKAKNAYLKVEKAKLSDSLTVAEMKKQVKALGDAYTKAHKKPVQSKPEAEESEEEPEIDQVQTEPVQDEVQSEAEESDNESDTEAVQVVPVQVIPVENETVTDAKLDKEAEKARKQAKKAENERKRALKAEKAKANADK